LRDEAGIDLLGGAFLGHHPSSPTKRLLALLQNSNGPSQ
jgi:hypothetical protein